MTEADRGIVDQINIFRAQRQEEEYMKRREEEVKKNRERQQSTEEIRRHKQALEQSFLIFQPIIEPMLQDIADKYRDSSGLPLEQPQVSPYKPVFSNLLSYPGEFALIWGTPRLSLYDFEERSIELYTRAHEKLTSGRKLSNRRREQYEQQLLRFRSQPIKIFGINTLVVVAGTESNSRQEPVVWLTGNTIVDVERELKYHDYDIRNGDMVPVLSKALANASGRNSFATDIQTLVTVGAKNIRPVGPFV